MTFKKKLLPSGVGKGSTGIGVEIFKVLLLGDAHVIVTTSCCGQATAEYDQGNFRGFGSRGLLLLSSFSSRQDYKQDVEALVELIHTNAGFDSDHKLHTVPLVAVPGNGFRSESIVEQQA
jgi:3-oxoacyl-ACP reductase-like protein